MLVKSIGQSRTLSWSNAAVIFLILMFLSSSGRANTSSLQESDSSTAIVQDTDVDEESSGQADKDSSETSEGDSQSSDPEASAAKSEQDAQRERLSRAQEEAADAPQQPFFNHWLWLVGLSLTLFLLAHLPRNQANAMLSESTTPVFDSVQRFAFRFTVVYLCLFYFPTPLTYLPYIGTWIYTTFQSAELTVIDFVAVNLLGIEPDWIPYSGSGDSTKAYVRLFSVFLLAVILSVTWSVVDRRKTDYRITRDLFHSNITYILALTMLGYGLAKCGYSRNQFPLNTGGMLESTWGDTTPMGALWKFMGASRPYTIFAGLGETVGAILLIFRRTRTLGALVVFGVMVNVVMLNFCYDVPVKINSTHLALLALLLVMRDFDRLGNILFFNRSTEPVDYRPPYTGRITIWVQRALKFAAVILWFGFPIYGHVAEEIRHANRPKDPEFFSSMQVKAYQVGDDIRDLEAEETWERIALQKRKWNMNREMIPTNWMQIKTHGDLFRSLTFELKDENRLVINQDPEQGLFVPKEMTISQSENGQWTLIGQTPDGELKVELAANDDSQTALMGRGFRWVNETPYSR